MIFLFCILWGLCATIRESGRKQFDAYFRNLIDGLMKGCSKPAGFKLGRAQMIPDGNLVFDYVTDVSKAGKGSFFNYIDKTTLGAEQGVASVQHLVMHASFRLE